MKKAISLVLALAMVFSLAACGGGAAAPAAGTEQTSGGGGDGAASDGKTAPSR